MYRGVQRSQRKKADETENLKSSVQHLLTDKSNPEKTKQQASEWGYALTVAPQEDFLVLPENWDAINLFIKSQTQWQYISGMSGSFKTGLNYQGVDTLIDIHFKGADKADLMSRVQVLEQEALRLFSAN